jgi:DNA-directed RNA polymerase specialized sigma subunit
MKMKILQFLSDFPNFIHLCNKALVRRKTAPSLADIEGIAHGKNADLVALDEALNELAKLDERLSRIVELRFFFGLSLEETPEALNISPRHVQREWRLAQAWLYRELSGEK